MAKHRTMRGQEVDVDLIRMKQELMQGKKTDATIKREDHINDRRRRSSSKRINEMLANEQMVRQKLAEQDKKLSSTATESSPPAAVPEVSATVPEVSATVPVATDPVVEQDATKRVIKK